MDIKQIRGKNEEKRLEFDAGNRRQAVAGHRIQDVFQRFLTGHIQGRYISIIRVSDNFTQPSKAMRAREKKMVIVSLPYMVPEIWLYQMQRWYLRDFLLGRLAGGGAIKLGWVVG